MLGKNVSLLAVALCSAAGAQTTLNLPRESQRATVSQRIGITDVTITYHRPLTRGRKIWGDLVPYGEIWRAGANECTRFDVSSNVTVESKPLAAGAYCLFMIPTANAWTVVLSKNTSQWGTYTYDAKEDALRAQVTPRPSDLHDALTYDFDELKPDSATLTLRWEKLAVPMRVQVDVPAITTAAMHDELRGQNKWNPQAWLEAADFLRSSRGDLKEALADVEQSIQLDERFSSLAMRAEILRALGRKEEAAAAQKVAIEHGTPLELHGYGRRLQQEGHAAEAFELFHENQKRNPNHWVVHNELARIASASGDFETAKREIKRAIELAPTQQQPPLQGLLKKLEAKRDINP